MKKIFILILIAASYQTYAQVNAELNKFILQSFSYYPKIQELNKTTEIAELKVDIARSNYLPNLNGTGTYSYINPVSQTVIPISATETKKLQFQPNNNYNANAGLNQLIWDFGKTKAQVEKAKADLLTTKQTADAAKLQLASQVTGIYYSMIYLKKVIQLQDTIIAFYETNQKIVEGKIKQGDALQIDLINIQNTIDQEKNRKIDFERQFERQVALMTFTTGQANLPAVTEFDFTGLTSRELNIDNNPDLLAANQRLYGAQADSRLAQSNKLPSLTFQASAGMKNGYQPDLNEMRFNYLAGATLTVPIFQGHRLYKSAVVANKSIELSEIAKVNTINTLQKDWQSAMADLKASEEQVKNTETQINASNEALRLTQVRFNRGVVTYLDLVFASTNVQRAYMTQLQYKYQATLAMAELARVQGVKFWQE
ncbi:MAG TPA: TolC family protein [Cyclobacteriaceae bacterium]|jgi:outer membrane protein TolC|nr:TolC family protein [Cyclobacteriaceae bacterium]